MTVALHDVVLLHELLSHVDNLADWDAIRPLLYRWHWSRKPLSSTVNILSVALYDLFGADGMYFQCFPQEYRTHRVLIGEELEILRTGCFKYFECGGECVNGPVSLLAG